MRSNRRSIRNLFALTWLDRSPNGSSSSSSPPQTATPSSFASDDGASPDITTAKRLPQVLPTTVDSPNARSKSVTHADGDDTYGVS